MEKYKELESTLEKMAKGLDAHLAAGIQDADIAEVAAAADAIKDISEAIEKTEKACYYKAITEAMKESEYGEDYDEDGPRYYRGRSARTGRYVHRSYTEPHMSGGTMYFEDRENNSDMAGKSYTEAYGQGHRRGYQEGHDVGRRMGYEEGQDAGRRMGYENAMMEHPRSRYDERRRGYEEMQEKHEDPAKKMQGLQEYLGVINEDLTDRMKKMDSQEKQLLRNTLASIQNKIS